MPATSVRQKFHEIVATTGDFQVADICRMKHFYFVSLEAMTLRFEHLGLIPKGTWDLLKESKFARAKRKQCWAFPHTRSTVAPCPNDTNTSPSMPTNEGSWATATLLTTFDAMWPRRGETVDQTLTSEEVDPSGEDCTVRMDFPKSLLREQVSR